MFFFTISVNVDSAQSGQLFAKYIMDNVPGLSSNQIQMSIHETSNHTMEAVIRVYWSRSDRSDSVDRGRRITWTEHLASGIAKFIVDVKEKSIVSRIISKQFNLTAREEIQAIHQMCCKLLGSGQEGIEARNLRILRVQTAIARYFEDQNSLHVDGFLNFRLKEYEGKLKETIEFAIDEYLLDKQYEEFISLLQYFVYFQDPMIPLVHLMHKRGNEFALMNEQFTPIQATHSGGVIARIADQELEMEDVIVSTLISLSPSRILIHTLDPDVQIITTIRRIFGERVELCLSCPDCRLYHHEARHRDQGM